MGGTAFEVAAGVQTCGLIQSLMSAVTVRLLSDELSGVEWKWTHLTCQVETGFFFLWGKKKGVKYCRKLSVWYLGRQLRATQAKLLFSLWHSKRYKTIYVAHHTVKIDSRCLEMHTCAVSLSYSSAYMCETGEETPKDRFIEIFSKSNSEFPLKMSLIKDIHFT